jgi:hypothetical protein
MLARYYDYQTKHPKKWCKKKNLEKKANEFRSIEGRR